MTVSIERRALRGCGPSPGVGPARLAAPPHRSRHSPPRRSPRGRHLASASCSRKPPRTEGSTAPFQQGLRELGYVEGQNLVIEWRWTEGKPDRLADVMAELIRLRVDVIVVGGGGAARAAWEATKTIPVVFVGVRDPVGYGFVASLARASGNVTGLSSMVSSELAGK